MPWFPIPFVLNEHGKLKTEDYRYTEVNWAQGVPSSLVSRGVGIVNTFSIAMGSDLDTTTPPPNKPTPRATYTDMNAGACSDISFTVRPRLHMLEYDKGDKKVFGYHIKYKLKMKRNPKAKTEKSTFRLRVCTQSIRVRPYYYYLRTSPFGLPGYWGGDANLFDFSSYDVMLDLTFTILPGGNGGMSRKIKEEPRGIDITHGALEKAGVREYDYYELGPLYDKYSGLTKEDVCTEYEVILPNDDSAVYLVIDALMDAPQVSLKLGECIYRNQDITSTGHIYATIELENEDDIIYGDGFSNIYLGSTNVEPGMMFKGEIEPTEIYIGENLVWSN